MNHHCYKQLHKNSEQYYFLLLDLLLIVCKVKMKTMEATLNLK